MAEFFYEKGLLVSVVMEDLREAHNVKREIALGDPLQWWWKSYHSFGDPLLHWC